MKVPEQRQGPVIAVREQAEVRQRAFWRAHTAFLLREQVAFQDEVSAMQFGKGGLHSLKSISRFPQPRR